MSLPPSFGQGGGRSLLCHSGTVRVWQDWATGVLLRQAQPRK
jgi:hypothetical protein